MIIQKASENQVTKIVHLLNSMPGIREYEGDIVEPDYVRGFIKNKNKFIFVAMDKGGIIGVATGYMWRLGRYAEIIDLVIREDYQTKGLGKKFVHYCIDYFKTKKLDYFLFHAREDNIKMQKCAETVDEERPNERLLKGSKCIHYCVDLKTGKNP